MTLDTSLSVFDNEALCNGEHELARAPISPSGFPFVSLAIRAQFSSIRETGELGKLAGISRVLDNPILLSFFPSTDKGKSPNHNILTMK
jgi:hypothetical protein